MTNLSPGDEDLHDGPIVHAWAPAVPLDADAELAWLHRWVAHKNAHLARGEPFEQSQRQEIQP